jgi:hypothetical protein
MMSMDATGSSVSWDPRKYEYGCNRFLCKLGHMQMMIMDATGSSESWDTLPVFCKKELSATSSYIQLCPFHKIGAIQYVVLR